MKFFKQVDHALFGWGSPVTMGVVRMATGTLALVNFLMLAIDFDAWFTERGFTPAWHATRWATDIFRLNLLEGQTDTRVTATLYVLLLVSCLLTAVGLWTRVASIAMFVLMATFHHRNPMILHSGDTILRQMSFFVMLAPSGAACSLDRLIAVWKGRAGPAPPQVSLWPQRLMAFQVTVVYFTTVWQKWSGIRWRDGTATWFVPQLHEFDRFPVPAFMDQQPFVAMTTYGTLVAELAVAFLAYSKVTRKWALGAGVLLHLGIEYRFNIPLFAFVMVSTYIAFFEGDEVSAWAKRLGARFHRWRVTASTPAGRELTASGAAFLESADAFDLVEIVSGTGDRWAAVNARGRPLRPYSAVLNRMPGLWILKLVPWVWRRLLDKSLAQHAAPSAVSSERQAVNT